MRVSSMMSVRSLYCRLFYFGNNEYLLANISLRGGFVLSADLVHGSDEADL